MRAPKLLLKVEIHMWEPLSGLMVVLGQLLLRIRGHFLIMDKLTGSSLQLLVVIAYKIDKMEVILVFKVIKMIHN